MVHVYAAEGLRASVIGGVGGSPDGNADEGPTEGPTRGKSGSLRRWNGCVAWVGLLSCVSAKNQKSLYSHPRYR